MLTKCMAHNLPKSEFWLGVSTALYDKRLPSMSLPFKIVTSHHILCFSSQCFTSCSYCDIPITYASSWNLTFIATLLWVFLNNWLYHFHSGMTNRLPKIEGIRKQACLVVNRAQSSTMIELFSYFIVTTWLVQIQWMGGYVKLAVSEDHTYYAKLIL